MTDNATTPLQWSTRLTASHTQWPSPGATGKGPPKPKHSRDILRDLQPAFILVVGIAGGVPSNSHTLGDVVVSTHIYDFRLGAVDRGEISFATRGDRIATSAAEIAVFLPAMKSTIENGKTAFIKCLDSADTICWGSTYFNAC